MIVLTAALRPQPSDSSPWILLWTRSSRQERRSPQRHREHGKRRFLKNLRASDWAEVFEKLPFSVPLVSLWSGFWVARERLLARRLCPPRSSQFQKPVGRLKV